MRLDSFIGSRQPRWSELDASVKKTRGGLRNLEADQLERFGSLYRQTQSDLALARRDFPDDTITVYLNTLCARAHSLLYRGDPPRLSSIPLFFMEGLPRTFRSSLRFFGLAVAVVIAGTVAGWLAVDLRPDLRISLVPSGSLFNELACGTATTVPPYAAISGFVISNNIRVAFLLFVSGITLGLLTTFSLFYNGWMLGTLGAAVHLNHCDALFWSYIVPHGAIELSVIMIAGGAGYMIAAAILRPGLRSRGDALVTIALQARGLALGVASLLVVAGIFEGFVSPSQLSPGVKYAIGAINFVWLYSWLFLAGRHPRVAKGRLNLDAALDHAPNAQPT